MSRDEFLRQLERLLITIPENDRLDAIAYYTDYFDEAGVEREQDVIRELGSPEKVAQTILEDYNGTRSSLHRDYCAPEEEDRYKEQTQWNNQTQSYEQTQSYGQTQSSSQRSEKKDIPWFLIIVIAVLTFPLWIGVVAGLFGAVVGIIAGIIGLLAGLFGSGLGITIGGTVTFVAGFFCLATAPMEGFVTIGVGAIMAAVGLLLLLLFAWIAFKWLPLLVIAISKGIKDIRHRDEGGNEI